MIQHIDIENKINEEITKLKKYFITHNLLSKGDTNAKTKKKARGFDIASYILYLAPDMSSSIEYNWGGFTYGYGDRFKNSLCPRSTNGCSSTGDNESCLYGAGMGRFETVKLARIRKSRFYKMCKELFMRKLKNEISNLVKKHRDGGEMLCIRLNGTSDITYEYNLIDGMNLFDAFPSVQFYCYTKIENRKLIYEKIRKFPPNYHLTFSISERQKSWDEIIALVRGGLNCAVVTTLAMDQKIPKIFTNGFNIVDGRSHDFRFLDEPNSLVILSALGNAKTDTTGFVKDLNRLPLAKCIRKTGFIKDLNRLSLC